jgi:hypothetical protein
MIRLFALIAALLCLPLPAGAEDIQWKAIACTADSPDTLRGLILTFYFSDSGQVHFKGTQYPATITSAEIDFCVSPGHCYTISRISGRFSAGAGVMSGACIPEGQKPKF